MPDVASKSSLAECQECNGNGWVHGEFGFRKCACYRERAIRAELPPRYHDARLDSFSPALQTRVSDWIREPGDGLLLSGAVGTGKTHLAAAIVRSRMELGKAPAFRRAADLYAGLRETYRVNTSEAELMRAYVESPLLVLDDLGAGALTDFERRITLEIFDRRLNNRRPTIVTTNWKLEDIAEKMDDRIASRLASYTNLVVSGKDRRLRTA
jgi:DNA replication protein DnaC